MKGRATLVLPENKVIDVGLYDHTPVIGDILLRSFCEQYRDCSQEVSENRHKKKLDVNYDTHYTKIEDHL